MTWFSETPWPPLVICAIAAGACLVAGMRGRGASLLIAGSVLALLCPLIFVTERLIVTDGERVEQRVHELADAFLRNDTDAFLAFFDRENVKLRGLAAAAIRMVELSNLSIKDLAVEDAGPAQAGRTLQSSFRANADATVGGFHAGHQPSRWKLMWQLRDSQWVIVAVHRMHPIREEEIEVLDAAPD